MDFRGWKMYTQTFCDVCMDVLWLWHTALLYRKQVKPAFICYRQPIQLIFVGHNRWSGFGLVFIRLSSLPRKLMHTANFLQLQETLLCADLFPISVTFCCSKCFLQCEQAWTLRKTLPIRRASGTSVPPFSLPGLLSPPSVRGRFSLPHNCTKGFK